jgi:hypothetical protein
MSKLNTIQKERLYQLVSVADAEGFTSEQAAQFITETLGITLTPAYIRYTRRKMRGESYSWLTKMKTSKDHYINEFKKRVEEVSIARAMFFKVYHHTDNDFVKVQCARGILKAAEDMSELYGVLPLIEGGLANNNINLVKGINNSNSSNVLGPKEISSTRTKEENGDLPV